MLAGEMMTAVTDILKPRMAEDAAPEKLGKIVLGTVEGDIHDIAKDIVGFMLDLNGFEGPTWGWTCRRRNSSRR